VSVEEPPSFKTVVDTYVAAIESLASGRYGLPWPGCADPAFSFGGENYAIVALRVSQEFYDEDDPEGLVENAHELIEATHREFGAELWGVVNRLDALWGPHSTLNADEYGDRAGGGGGEFASELLSEINRNELTCDLKVWKVGDRRIALGVGQSHLEEPVVLFAGVTASAEGFPA
jgi:hypothetical protein